jgi:hypothetical protein
LKSKKGTKRSSSSKPVQKRSKSIFDTSFFAGFMGAKAAGLSDDEALIAGVIFDEED